MRLGCFYLVACLSFSVQLLALTMCTWIFLYNTTVSGCSFLLFRRGKDKEKCVYRLTGVVEHMGTMRGGHYVAYIRGSEKSKNGAGASVWYHASDAYVREVTLEEVLRCEAYILFYEIIWIQPTFLFWYIILDSLSLKSMWAFLEGDTREKAEREYMGWVNNRVVIYPELYSYCFFFFEM